MSQTVDAPGLEAEQTAEIVEQYTRNGFVQVRSLLSDTDVTHIREVFTAQVETDRSLGSNDAVPEDDILARYPRFVHPHRRTDLEAGRLARSWMLEPRIIDLVTALIGDPLAAQSMFYFKPPTARGQSLHQDNVFLQAHPETCLAAWIAVDDCDTDNGALKVVPGSHRYEVICKDQYKEADATESFTTVEIDLPEGVEVEQTQMRAGDVLFFHGSLVHGSAPNRTTDRFRRSLIFHYVPAASTELAQFYNPVLTPGGEETTVAPSTDGGPCGEGWQEAH